MARQELTFAGLVAVIEAGLGTQTTAFVPTYESVTTLLDKIGLTFTNDTSFTDGLAFFDDVHLEDGATVEEFITDLLVVEDFAPDANPMDGTATDEIDVKRAYHYRSNDKKIKLKLSHSQMRRAFKGRETFAMFVAQAMKRIADTHTVYKYEAKKVGIREYLGVIGNASADTVANIIAIDKDTKSANFLLASTPQPTDEASGIVFIKAIKDLVTDMTISAKRKYNPFGVEQQASKAGMVLLIDQSIMSTLDVYNYASAFNKELLGLGIEVVEIDKGSLNWVDEQGDGWDAWAMLTDKRLVRYMTTLEETTVDINGEARYTLYTRHFGENIVVSKAIPLVVFGSEVTGD